MSVADILKREGKWMLSETYVRLVSKELEKSERQAYRKIKEAVRKKEVLRHLLPDRTVLYGLAEFGPFHSNDETSEKQSVRTLSKEEREKQERLAEFYANAKFLANAYPTMKPLKDYADTLKKTRKKMGLEP